MILDTQIHPLLQS